MSIDVTQSTCAPKSSQANLPPVTTEQELAWILQYEETAGPLADYIAAARYRAVYGTWPDGVQVRVPDVAGIASNDRKWLIGQSSTGKWTKARVQAMKTGWESVLSSRLPIRVNPAGGKPKPPAREPEAFPGQRQWLREQAQRELRLDAAVREPRIRLQLYDLRTERDSIKAWFEPHLGIVDDAEWKAHFIRLQELAETIKQLEADLQMVEKLLGGNKAAKPYRPKRAVNRDLTPHDCFDLKRDWRKQKRVLEIEPLAPIVTENVLPGDDSLIDILQSEIPDPRMIWKRSLVKVRADRCNSRFRIRNASR